VGTNKKQFLRRKKGGRRTWNYALWESDFKLYALEGRKGKFLGGKRGEKRKEHTCSHTVAGESR